MRLLHTADWHINSRLGRIDRQEDISRALKRIAEYLETYRVDVMLVAGDLVERGRPDELRRAISEVREMFLPFLSRGGTIVAISGNHDSEVFFETLHDALDLVVSGFTPATQTQPPGRLYITANPSLLQLADAQDTPVQFVLMPYPTARSYLRDHHEPYRSLADKQRLLQAAYLRTLEHLTDPNQGFRPDQPHVLVSHVHVRGAQAHGLFRLTDVEDVIFEPSDIPVRWTYGAYGHIHRPQTSLHDESHMRYAGSIERFDLGERDDDKSVVLFEIGPDGLLEEIMLLPLPATPIYAVTITNPDIDIPLLSARYPDAAHALVNYTLHWQPGRHNREMLCQQINAIFPRWYSRTLREVGQDLQPIEQLSRSELTDVPGTVRAYLAGRLSNDPQRDALLALAEQLLTEEPKI